MKNLGSAVLLLSCVVFDGCSDRCRSRGVQPLPEVRGTIVVELVEYRHDHTKYQQLQFRPASGELSVLQNAHQQVATKGARPIGFAGVLIKCVDNPSLPSPMHALIATCFQPAGSGDSQISVFDQGSHAQLWSEPLPRGTELAGFQWNREGSALAILLTESRPSNGIAGLLTGFLGHPKPNETIELQLIEPIKNHATNYVLCEDLSYSSARIVDWQ